VIYPKLHNPKQRIKELEEKIHSEHAAFYHKITYHISPKYLKYLIIWARKGIKETEYM
jgi:hypothetical protein